MPLAIHKYCSDERKRNDTLKRPKKICNKNMYKLKVLSENYKIFKAFIS